MMFGRMSAGAEQPIRYPSVARSRRCPVRAQTRAGVRVDCWRPPGLVEQPEVRPGEVFPVVRGSEPRQVGLIRPAQVQTADGGRQHRETDGRGKQLPALARYRFEGL